MTGAIIVAAGKSSRMNGKDKLLENIDGMSILARTLYNFEDCDEVNYVVVVTRDDLIDTVKGMVQSYKLRKVIKIVTGGESRQSSVQRGIEACPLDTEIIAIHDAARPFADSELIKAAILDCMKYGATVLGVNAKDTVKVVEDGFVVSTPNRDNMYSIQTPQVFNFKTYRGCLKEINARGLSFTDDSQLLEYFGHKVHIICGSYMNIKITTPEDIDIARVFASKSIGIKY